jgi:hypothetical protein
MYLFTKVFWAYSFERIAKTFAQVMIAGLTVSAFVPSSAESWVGALATAGVASLVSLLTAVTAFSAASGTESTPVSTVSAKSATVPLFTVKS